MSLLFPGNWQRCDCVPISTSTRQVSPVITEHFPPLSHLVISHQPWARVMDHPAQLCSGKQGMFLSTSQGEWPGFGSLHSHGASGEGPAGRDPQQVPALSNVPCRLQDSSSQGWTCSAWKLKLWGVGASFQSMCHFILPHPSPSLCFAGKVMPPNFPWISSKSSWSFSKLLFFSSSKTFIIQFIGEADNEQHKFNLVLTAFKSKIWIYT